MDSVVGDVNVHAKTKRLLAPRSGGTSRIMRGLDVAIVDEVDSVLVDDAGTPLLISAEAPNRIDEETAGKALEIGRAMVNRVDFIADTHGIAVELTEFGREKVDSLTRPILAVPGSSASDAMKWYVRRPTAVHCLKRDRQLSRARWQDCTDR